VNSGDLVAVLYVNSQY